MTDIPLTKPSLSDVLSVALPTEQDTLLLQACLTEDQRAKRAWKEWQLHRSGYRNGLMDDPGPVRPLGALVCSALLRHGFEADNESRTYLRSASLREELRTRTFRRICADVLRLLHREGIAAVVLKGTALGETVYSSPVLRHCHDIEILVEDEDLIRAANLLPSLGFTASVSKIHRSDGYFQLEHESGLPVQLHTRLFDLPCHDLPVSEMWRRSRRQIIAGAPARILSPSDNLLHVCGYAFYSPSRRSLRWVTDAWFIIQRHPDLDWDLLLDCARRSYLALPLFVMLGYLAEHLKAPIRASVLHRLSAAASKSPAIERQAALHGARAAPQGNLRELFKRATNWRERAFLVRWLLFPSPIYLSWVDRIPYAWLVPFHYIYRPLHYAACRLRSKLQSLIRCILSPTAHVCYGFMPDRLASRPGGRNRKLK